MQSKSLNKSMLRKLIKEEKRILQETLELGLKTPEESAKKTKEIKANKLSKTVMQCIDHYKLCIVKEEALKKDLERIQEIKSHLKNKMLENL